MVDEVEQPEEKLMTLTEEQNAEIMETIIDFMLESFPDDFMEHIIRNALSMALVMIHDKKPRTMVITPEIDGVRLVRFGFKVEGDPAPPIELAALWQSLQMTVIRNRMDRNREILEDDRPTNLFEAIIGRGIPEAICPCPKCTARRAAGEKVTKH